MLKLTRLNQHTVAINPDHISWVEANPDTTLCLINGEKIIVRESVDELIERVVSYRRRVRPDATDAVAAALGPVEGDPPHVAGWRPNRNGAPGSAAPHPSVNAPRDPENL